MAEQQTQSDAGLSELADAAMRDHARLEAERARLARALADADKRRLDAEDRAEKLEDEVGGLERELVRRGEELRGARATVAELTARLAAVRAAVREG